MNKSCSLLDSTVRRPADAEKFRLEKIAEANKNRYKSNGIRFANKSA